MTYLIVIMSIYFSIKVAAMIIETIYAFLQSVGNVVEGIRKYGAEEYLKRRRKDEDRIIGFKVED